MTGSVGVVISAYTPDVPTLEAFVDDRRDALPAATIRVEIDAPDASTVARLETVADTVDAVPERRGKGGAIMDGFDALEADVLVFADADSSVPATSVRDVVRQVDGGTADVSIASRRHPTSNVVTHQTVFRQFLGDAFAFTARRLLPTRCRDYQCGTKAVSEQAWAVIGHHCYEPGFAWDLEFASVAGSLGYDIAEVPVEWHDYPDSTVDPLSTSLELAAALVDVKRRTGALAASPRFSDVVTTDRSRLTTRNEDGE